MAINFHYPEMHEQRRADSQIEARLGHYGRHWYITTPLLLSGRGIRLLKVLDAGTLTPAARHKAGWREYCVTEKAMERLAQQYIVTSELLL